MEKDFGEMKEGWPLILIPAFNEGERIAAVVEEVRKEIPLAGILVVDDGSGDGTAARARAAGAKVLSHPFNLGYGVALQTGYRYALAGGFPWVLQMDGDGQHDPSYLPALLRKVQEGADVAVGSRFLGEGDYRAGFLRRTGMRLFGLLAGWLNGQAVTDPTSGFQALSRRAVALCAGDAFPGDYPDADVLVMLHRAGLRIAEVPVGMRPNRKGRSMHQGWKPLYYTYKMLLSMTLTLVRRECRS